MNLKQSVRKHVVQNLAWVAGLINIFFGVIYAYFFNHSSIAASAVICGLLSLIASPLLLRINPFISAVFTIAVNYYVVLFTVTKTGSTSDATSRSRNGMGHI